MERILYNLMGGKIKIKYMNIIIASGFGSAIGILFNSAYRRGFGGNAIGLNDVMTLLLIIFFYMLVRDLQEDEDE